MKGETERHERLVEIQNKLEQNGFSRVDNPIVTEFNGVSTRRGQEEVDRVLGWRGWRDRPPVSSAKCDWRLQCSL